MEVKFQREREGERVLIIKNKKMFFIMVLDKKEREMVKTY